jgi:hypothetical protein
VKTKGVCYDVGREMMGRSWRPVFDPAIIRSELGIIRDALHCNAVRVQGVDPGRLVQASEIALELGLEVWYSPELWDREPEATLAYLTESARAAQRLAERWPDRIVFSVGSELTLFQGGILPGNNVLERLSNPSLAALIRSERTRAALADFLARATEAVRREFVGRLTYASLVFEKVDWSLFDIVGADLYRGAELRERYGEVLASYRSFGKPVANLEFGCCTFRGAAELGGRGWDIVDFAARPIRLKGDYVYDQRAQAEEVVDLVRANAAAGIDATFVFTFLQPRQELSAEEQEALAHVTFDPDITNYSLVKNLPDGTTGTAFPGLPWEPKESFRALAAEYAAA